MRGSTRFSLMQKRMIGIAGAVCVLTTVSKVSAQPPSHPILIRISTTLGTIDAVLDSTRAPVSVTNILRYIDGGFYKSGRFHRAVTMQNQPDNIVKIEVVQGAPARDSTRRGFSPIELERTSVTGLKHLDGTRSMARAGPNSATAEFFPLHRRAAGARFRGARAMRMGKGSRPLDRSPQGWM